MVRWLSSICVRPILIVCMKQSMFGSSLPQLFVGELMFYACYFCLVVHSGVQHVLTI
jgi:hypothetical protein